MEHDASAGAGLHHLPSALRHGRGARGWSQRALAARVGVAQSFVARLESGVRPAAVEDLIAVLGELGFSLVLTHDDPARCAPDRGEGAACRDWIGDGDVHHRDEAGRAFPAHAEAQWQERPPLYWQFRRGWPWPVPGAMLWHYRLPGRREEGNREGG